MNKETREDLFKICINNVNLKIEKYPDIFSVDSTLLIVGRIMSQDNKQFENKNINNFLINGNISEYDMNLFLKTLNF